MTPESFLLGDIGRLIQIFLASLFCRTRVLSVNFRKESVSFFKICS